MTAAASLPTVLLAGAALPGLSELVAALGAPVQALEPAAPAAGGVAVVGIGPAGPSPEQAALVRARLAADAPVLVAHDGDAAAVHAALGEPDGPVAYLPWPASSALLRSRVALLARLAAPGVPGGEAAEARYWRLVEVLPEPVLVHDGERVLYANPSTALLLGLDTPDALVGRPVLEIVHPEFREFVRERVAYARASGGPVPLATERLLRADGTEAEVEVTSVPFEFAGRAAFLTVARDVEQRRRLEEQLRLSQRMEAVGRLAGGIAHDFNNLLTAIKGNADLLLLDLPEGDPAREDVGEILHAAQRAADLTRQLLAFGRGQVLRPRVLVLNETVESACRMLRRLLPEHVELSVRLDPARCRIRADPTQLEQILLNLALNARDAMPEGGTLDVRTDALQLQPGEGAVPRYVSPGRYVRLSVSDTGHGIAAEQLERVFEPFFTTKEKGKGTGLGLSTVYGIVKQSGGFVWAESQPGRGSTFRIVFPPAPDGAEPTEHAGPGPARGGAGTVLLVDDEEPVRRLARRVLERAGCRVLEAADGREAMEVWGEHGAEVDLLVTDVVMPVMGGRELAARIRRERPELGVVYLTGYMSEASLRAEVLEPGAELVLKPFDGPELVSVVLEKVAAGRGAAPA